MPPAARKPFILPYETDYTGHWEAENRHRLVKRFLDARIAAIADSPSVAPDLRDLAKPAPPSAAERPRQKA